MKNWVTEILWFAAGMVFCLALLASISRLESSTKASVKQDAPALTDSQKLDRLYKWKLEERQDIERWKKSFEEGEKAMRRKK